MNKLFWFSDEVTPLTLENTLRGSKPEEFKNIDAQRKVECYKKLSILVNLGASKTPAMLVYRGWSHPGLIQKDWGGRFTLLGIVIHYNDKHLYLKWFYISQLQSFFK